MNGDSSQHSSLGDFLLQEIVRTRSDMINSQGFESVVIAAWKELSIFMADFLGNALLKTRKAKPPTCSSEGTSSSVRRESSKSVAPEDDDKSCLKCGKVFAKIRSRDFHESTCGSFPRVRWPSLKCPFCPLISDHFLRFKKHVADCCPKDTTLCPQCFQPLPPGGKPGLHEGCEYVLKCVKCKFIAGYMDAYRSHYTEAHLMRPASSHQCATCGKTFNRPSRLKMHAVTHTGERSFVCSECGKAFPRMNGLRLHREVHVKESIPCEVCGKVYESRRKLRIHKNTVHPAEVETITCPHCKASFHKHTTFMHHVTSLHPEEVEQCGQCGITYTSRANFDEHGCEKKDNNNGVTPLTTIIHVADIMAGEIIGNEVVMGE